MQTTLLNLDRFYAKEKFVLTQFFFINKSYIKILPYIIGINTFLNLESAFEVVIISFYILWVKSKYWQYNLIITFFYFNFL